MDVELEYQVMMAKSWYEKMFTTNNNLING
jgi:hypothetical protein